MSCIFWIAFSFGVGLVCGIVGGWQLCRGLVQAQEVDVEGTKVLRVALDPGKYPWSGAETRFIPLSGK